MSNEQVTKSNNNKKRKNKDDLDYHSITMFHKDGSSTVYPESHKLTSGGSKQIFKLNDEDVIAVVGNHEGTRSYIQSEVAFSNELRKMGLRAQYYEAAEIKMDHEDTLIPVLKMPSFQFLAQNGHQIRDQKNHSSSAGDSLIFANKENLSSEVHWRKIMTPLVNDMYIYLINGLDFAGDAWNVVIEDTADTPVKGQQDSLLITDRAQEIHFYFFDFGNSTFNLADFKTKYNFLDLQGRISEEDIIRNVNRMKDTVLSLVVDTCTDKQEYNSLICGNKNLFKPVFEKIWSEVAMLVTQKIKIHLEGLSEETLLDTFTSHSKETISYFRQMKLDRENILQEIRQMEEEQLQQREADKRVESLRAQKEEVKNNKIDGLMKKIDATLEGLLSKIDTIDYHLPEAKTAAEKLYLKFKEARIAYEGHLKTGKDKNEKDITPLKAWDLFNIQCRRAINKAMPVLERDLDWGDYIENIFKNIANAVICCFGTSNNFFKPVQSKSSVTALEAGKALDSEEIEGLRANI